MSTKTFPVKAGEQVQLKINGLNHSGEGVGRCQGLAVFVPFTVPGEEVVVRIGQVKKNFARAELLRVVEESADRCAPNCDNHGRCGGCQFQHMNYAEQLRAKTRMVEDSLLRIGKLQGIKVHPTLGMEKPWGYRNKVHFKVVKRGAELYLGYYGYGDEVEALPSKAELVPAHLKQLLRVEDCFLIDADMNQVAVIVQSLLNTFHPEKEGQEFFRHVVLRKSSLSDEIMVVVVTESGDWAEELKFATEIMNLYPGVVSVIRNENLAKSGVVMGAYSRTLAGKDKLLDEIGGIRYTFSAESFFQVNPLQTKVLYEKVLDYAGLTGRETVIDAFCGAGTISLFLAKMAKKVYGLELISKAVQDAKENACFNHINNTEFMVGKTEELLPKLYRQGVKPDVIILDPPRKGCATTALAAIGDMQPQRVVYVSCDPASLARDLAVLDRLGYSTVEVQPVDMFPQTSHVECCCLLYRKDS
ncbi:MAG: 23S rRNA (uracil(1939)-C(5))-methyltransferase RlmD [Carboxydocellales bacterium]